MKARRYMIVVAVGSVVALVATACGTRLSGEELEAARGPANGQEVVAAGSGSEQGTSSIEGGSAEGASAERGAAETGAAEAASIEGEPRAQEGGTSDNPPSAPGSSSGGDPSTPPGPATPSPEGPRGEPLVLGHVNTLSGPASQNSKPVTDMLRVWVRDVNARGGVDGRPIELVVADDGLDEARHFSAIRELVENRKAFAFLANSDRTTAGGGQQYLEEHGVPLVGGSALSAKGWDSSPVIFPQGLSYRDQFFAHVAGAARMRPKAKKWGQLTCREVQGCREARQLWPQHADRLGLSVVYQGEASIAQPDYTAECLAARDAGAELLGVLLDTNAIRRFAQSCARQNYRPTFVINNLVLSTSQDEDANFEGAVGIINTAPWPATDVPAVRAMHDAMKRFAPNLALDTGSAMGWSAGKLFEAAVGAAGGLGSVPSRERLFDGLYRLRNETLDGVSPPLSFERGKDKRVPCWFSMEFRGGSWKAANGGRHTCP